MARSRDIFSKVRQLREDSSRLNRAKETEEIVKKRAAGIGERGRFMKMADIQEARNYAVVLRAQIRQEDFRIFRATLNAMGGEIKSWANVANAAFQTVKTGMEAYSSLAQDAFSRESSAIDFGNRLGLSLPQSRIWSKVFKQFNITSFDQFAEMMRNPLTRARIENAARTQAEATGQFNSVEFQEGIKKWNDLLQAFDTGKIRLQNFVDILVTSTNNLGGFSDKLINILKDFNPKIESGKPLKSLGNLVGAASEAIDKNTFQGATALSGAALTGLSALLIGITTETFGASLKLLGADKGFWGGLSVKFGTTLSSIFTKVFLPAAITHAAVTLFNASEIGQSFWDNIVELIQGPAKKGGVLTSQDMKDISEGKITPKEAVERRQKEYSGSYKRQKFGYANPEERAKRLQNAMEPLYKGRIVDALEKAETREIEVQNLKASHLGETLGIRGNGLEAGILNTINKPVDIHMDVGGITVNVPSGMNPEEIPGLIAKGLKEQLNDILNATSKSDNSLLNLSSSQIASMGGPVYG